MMKNTLFLLFLTITIYSCGSIDNSTTMPEVIYFSDIVEVDQIDSVLMNNNFGEHLIMDSKLEKFKLQLEKMTLDKGSYKVGSIGFVVYIKGVGYHFYGSSQGNYIEASSEIITKNKSWVNEGWVSFNINSLNLHNY